MKVSVVGAGINGLASAFHIKKAYPNVSVTVIAKDFTPNTTSDIAAGWWEPFCAGETPIELIHRWSKVTYDYGFTLLMNDPHALEHGIRTQQGCFLDIKDHIQDPFWRDIVHDYRYLTKKELERYPKEIKSGFGFTGLYFEGKRFLPSLMKKLKDLGGQFLQKEIKSFKELYSEYDVIINCAGLANRYLSDDHSIYPVRGQVIRVKAPWVTEYCNLNYDVDPNLTTYILPNQDYVVLGGTQYKENWNTSPTEEDTQWILESTKKLEPSLEKAEVKEICVGLRPVRKCIRLERENIKSSEIKTIKMIHNYGHGGSGLTLFWGCAQDVLQLFTQIVGESKHKSKL